MKKLNFLILTLLITMPMWAQKVMQVHSGDDVVYAIPTVQVDSITFKTCECEEVISFDPKKPPVSADCWSVLSFTENYLESFQNDEIFIIKGVVLDALFYGRNIKVIEDLKGNFADKSSIFVYGNNSDFDKYPIVVNERSDNFDRYHKGDTLIIIMEKVRRIYEGYIETCCDYATLVCASSIVNLSNDYITGYIKPLEGMAQTMLWEEFQEEVAEIVKNLQQ